MTLLDIQQTIFSFLHGIIGVISINRLKVADFENIYFF